MKAGSARFTAIHEAAHAVLAVRLGLPLLSCNLRPPITHLEPGAKGDADTNDDNDFFRAYAIYASGGMVSEITFPDKRVDAKEAYDGDLNDVLTAAARTGVEYEQASRWSMDRVEEAKRILDADGRKAWLHVASALEKRGTLSAEEVRVIVGRFPVALAVIKSLRYRLADGDDHQTIESRS